MLLTRRLLLCSAAALACADAGAQPSGLATPAPLGPIGRVERPLPHNARALIHYPAAPSVARTLTRAAQMPASHRQNLTRRFGADAADALLNGSGYAQPGAQAAEARHPVLLFAPGARLLAHDYRAILECVASAGYVVVALSEAGDYNATADAFVRSLDAIDAWRADADDRLGAACGDVIACFGHSIGGAAGVLAASRSPRIRAAANLDGDYAPPANSARPTQPLLYLLGSDAHEPERSRNRRRNDWVEVSSRSANAHAFRCADFRHLNFLDAALLANIPADRRNGRFGNVDAARGLDATAQLLTGFFDEHLKNQAGALARAVAAAAPIPSAYR